MTETHGLSIKRIAGYTAIIMATLAFLYVLYKLNEVVLLFMLSIAVAAALRKGVLALEARRVPRGVAILCWYGVIIGVLALGVFFLGGSLGKELQIASNEVPQRYDQFITRLQHRSAPWAQSLVQRLPHTNTVLQELGQGGASDLGFQIAGITSSILNLVISLVAVLTLTFYWLADQDRFERLWLTLLPVNQRTIARNIWRDVEYRVGVYVRSEALQFVLTVVILWGAFSLLGTPYPTAYALFAGIIQLIPWIGIPLTLLPLCLMLLFNPPWLILATGAVIIVVGILMDQGLEPRLSGDAAIHPILTVLALLIMGDAAGVLGLVIALPLAALFQAVLGEILRVSMSSHTTAVAETAQVVDLQERIERLRKEMPHDPGRRREAEGILSRLEALMAQTDVLVREHQRGSNGGRDARTRASTMVQRSQK